MSIKHKSEILASHKSVSLEDAKKLKELGYSKKCNWYYLGLDIPHVEKGLKYSDKSMNHNMYDEFIYSAPSKECLEVIKLLKKVNNND